MCRHSPLHGASIIVAEGRRTVRSYSANTRWYYAINLCDNLFRRLQGTRRRYFELLYKY